MEQQRLQGSALNQQEPALSPAAQHAEGPQERSGITGQEQNLQLGLHSNHQTNSVPGDVLIGLLTNYGPEDSFTPCFRPSSSVTYFSLLANPEEQPLHAQQLRIPRLSGTISVSSLLRPSATPHFPAIVLLDQLAIPTPILWPLRPQNRLKLRI